MERRAKKISGILKREYPEAKTELEFNSPFQMLVATILSAQTTDASVNRVTPGLFGKYPDAKKLAEAPVEEIQNQIKSINFYRNKSKNIKKLSQIITEDFEGQVPDSIEELVSLPGVARKTANVVLAEVYGKAEGIVVDTHVKRLSARLGLTKNTTPEKIELDLMRIVPKDSWISFSMGLILHGRRVCKAQKPLCGICRLEKICPYQYKNK